jgi:hypothetical protein
MNEDKDSRLWRMAAKRAGFRKSLFSYLIINAFLWGIWWFTTGRIGHHGYPWPVWVMLGWGVGLAFQYFEAYHGEKQDITQQEYERLKKEQGL